MHKNSIFSDGTKEYRNPAEPKEFEKVTIRLRVAHGPAVVLLHTPKYNLPMTLEREEDRFDYYSATVLLDSKPLQYLFEITQNATTVYYDRYSVCEGIRWEYAFCIVPGFSTPDWTKGAIMYQILVDRFANGDETNDVLSNEYYYINMPAQKVDDWNSKPDNFDVCRFYGGDLEGVRQKLYYLKSLGVEAIYFNPIFVSPSNHKYDAQDYEHIDPHYGKIVYDEGELLADGDSNNANASRYRNRTTDPRNLEASDAFFAEFVKEAHEKGIRVILDGVFNHCGSFNKWLDREKLYESKGGYEPGAFSTEDSKYHDYFMFHENKWPDNTSYDSWWGNDTLPKLNYEESETLCKHIIEVGKKWVSPPYNCDGWRLDVAADLGHTEEFNHQFWRRFRDEIKKANPDAVILAEHYGNPSSWLCGDQWDTIMNYDAFMEPVTYFLTGMDKHSDEYKKELCGDGASFEATMRYHMTKMMTPSLLASMNQLSNHDHSRFLTRTNHKVGRVATLGSCAAEEGVNFSIMKLAVLMQLTWPGAPTLYYGDEAGVCGFTDPDNRRTYPWGNANYELIDYHRDAIFMHKTSPALRRGSFSFIECGRDFVSYARFTQDQKCIVAINSSGSPKTVTIPAYLAEVPENCQMQIVFQTSAMSYSIKPVKVDVVDGMITLEMKPYGGLVLRYEG